MTNEEGKPLKKPRTRVIRRPKGVRGQLETILGNLPEGYVIERIIVREYEIILTRNQTMVIRGARVRRLTQNTEARKKK